METFYGSLMKYENTRILQWAFVQFFFTAEDGVRKVVWVLCMNENCTQREEIVIILRHEANNSGSEIIFVY